MSSISATSSSKAGIISSTRNSMVASSLKDYNDPLYLHPSDSSAIGFDKFASNYVMCDSENKYESVILTPEMNIRLVKLLDSQKINEGAIVNMTCVLVNSTYFNASVCCWILDSGPTDHMISDLNMLYDLKDVSKENILVNLSNGSYVLVKYTEKCLLIPGLVLKRVLYVPDFKFNLLSVSKVTTENKCVIKFLNNFW